MLVDLGTPCEPRGGGLDRRAGEGPFAGQALQQEEPEGVDVGLAGDLAAQDLLRGDVRGGADHGPRPRHAGGVAEQGDAEVGELDVLAVALEQHVRGLHVPVHDALRVHGGEPLGDLGTHPGGRRGVEGSLAQPGVEVAAGDELHHEVRVAVLVVECGVVERDERRAAERGEGVHLRLGPGTFAVVDGPDPEDLDGDLAAELLVDGAVDGGHAAVPERAGDAVPAAEDPFFHAGEPTVAT